MPSIQSQLPDAVREIVSATTRRTSREPNAFPFFFIIGAGVSYPFIPLAAGVERLCREEIARQGLPSPPDFGSMMDRYERCFRDAFPQAEERRAFLHERIHRAPISPANFRLAHLLGSRKLTNLVLTPNFDEMLTRALRLFGSDVVVCDHPKTTQRIDPRQVDVLQIVHVHGTHWFYDCCNLRGEIEGQARSDHTDNASMGQLLDRVLFDRSPLVVGYSGWEGDVLMTALKRRLMQPTLRYNVYWFCFSRADANALPPWLREHPSVRLVVPPGSSPVEQRASPGDDLSVMVPAAAFRGDGGAFEPTLPARQVFEALLVRLSLEAPGLTIDPLSFFAEHLESNLAIDNDEHGKDTYLIREVIDRVKLGARLEREHREGVSREKRDAAERLTRVSDAVRRSAYREAVEVAAGIKLDALSTVECQELEAALDAIEAGMLDTDPAAGLAACKLRLRLLSRAKQIAAASGKASREGEIEWALREAKVNHRKGACYDALGLRREAITAYEEVIERLGAATEPSLKEQIARALMSKGMNLSKLNMKEEAVQAYDEIVARFSDAPELSLRENVARALLNKGIICAEKDRSPEEIITIYDEVVVRFGAASEPGLKNEVARALILKGANLAKSVDHGRAVVIYDDVVQRFSGAQELALKEQVARAIFSKALTFDRAGLREEAITTYDDLVARFKASKEPPLLRRVARALLNKASCLDRGDRKDEAVKVYDEIIVRFDGATEAALRERVAAALVGKGMSLSTKGQSTEAIAAYNEVIMRFQDADEPELMPYVERARREQADILWPASSKVGEQ